MTQMCRRDGHTPRRASEAPAPEMSMSSARVLPASLVARAPVASGLRRGDRRACGVARARPPTAPPVHASICGIDLGTTNSCVAVVIDGRPVLVPDEKGRRTIPSVVHFAVDGSVAVGRVAAKRLTRDPANTFHSTKRFIGKRFKEKKVAEDARRVPYEVCATVAADAEAMGLAGLGPSGNGAGFVAVRCPALGRKVSPEEVAAAILAKCLAMASDALGGDAIEKAVIAVPAYFDDGQCAATERAGLRAGLKTVKLIREPIAAALAYGVDVEGDETVFVFDLGGGTFDVSVLDVGGGAVEVLATGGDAHLGGDDLDRAVAVWLAKEARALGAAVDPRGALQAARRAREKLSDAAEVVVPMPGGATKTLTRPLLEKVCSETLRDLRLPVETAADSAGINLEALQAESRGKKNARRSKKTGRPFDHVLLVGGATKTPAVRRFVENTFGRRPTPGLVDPDEVVALGAAAHAGALEGLVAQTETLGPMQASLIRAFARKMRDEDEAAFERVGDASERGGAFDAAAAAAAAAAAGMDLVEEDDDDWGPEDLSELEGLSEEEIEARIAEMGDEGEGEEDEARA